MAARSSYKLAPRHRPGTSRRRFGTAQLVAVLLVLVAACSDGAGDAVPANSVPPAAASVATAATTTTPSVTTTTLPDTYVLQPGDSPSLLADQFGLTMAELEQFNAGNPDYFTFLVGAVIRLTPPPTTTAPPTTAPASTTTNPPTPGQVTMAFSGEVLAHRVINRTALQPDGSYDYWPMLANIAPLVSEADYTICHLEAPIAPPGEEVMVEPQRISSAASITTALATAGFDRCSTASNHSVDRGAAGVDATVAAFEAAGIDQSGVARSEQERLPRIVVVNDVKVAHLAYSYGFDGTPLPAGEPWRANVIDPAVIIADAQAMRAIGAEVVVLSLHWGSSMVSNPTAEQQRVADAVTASGAVDLIVGHHSHVLQPITQVNGVWVVWGLSNFLSALPTSDKWPAKSQDGVLVSVRFTRASDASIEVSVPTVRTTWCDKANGFVVRATSEQHDPNLSAAVREQLRISEERSRAVVGDFMTP